MKRTENSSHRSTRCVAVVGMDIRLTFSLGCLVPSVTRSPQADLYQSTQHAGSMDCRAGESHVPSDATCGFSITTTQLLGKHCGTDHVAGLSAGFSMLFLTSRSNAGLTRRKWHKTRRKKKANVIELMLWFNPSWQLSTMQPLAHSPPTPGMGERIGKKTS